MNGLVLLNNLDFKGKGLKMNIFVIKKELLPNRYVRMYKRRNIISQKNDLYMLYGLNQKTAQILHNIIEENKKERSL